MKNKNDSKRIAIPENTVAAGRRPTVGLSRSMGRRIGVGACEGNKE